VSRTKLKRKRLSQYPQSYRDALAHWAAFRKLGFSADEIFFGFGPVSREPDIMHVQLATQGKTFTVVVAQLMGAQRDSVVRMWEEISALYNEAPDKDRDAVHEGHLIGSSLDYFATFAQAIIAKGVIAPELIPFMNPAQA
jgi:hypothetical protein